VRRASVPEEEKEGDIFTIEHEGKSVLITVVEIEDEFVTCDLNHPWAGQTLSYEIKLQKIFPAADSARPFLPGGRKGLGWWDELSARRALWFPPLPSPHPRRRGF